VELVLIIKIIYCVNLRVLIVLKGTYDIVNFRGGACNFEVFEGKYGILP
jgi:hypothetical protein